ncbi:MAG: DUF2336 domain-containing protein [Parvibaculum sp.]|nr:DUF2336 domain-containing protein [Parvibaculum sp.]
MSQQPPYERLTLANVDHLFSEPTEDVREQIAFKVASQFGNVVLTPRERELAREILGYLVLDVSVLVRKALSGALSDLPDAPYDIVLHLAHDVDEVAQPLLENSPVFTDQDLAELVLSGTVHRQVIIASRPNLGPEASGAIARKADRDAVLVLIANDGVILRPDVLDSIIQRYADDEDILDPMARRTDLPMRIVERIVTFVSSSLREHLVELHRVDPAIAAVLEGQARERTLVAMMDRANGNNLDGLLEQLIATDMLTPSILLRAVCAGEIEFVIKGLAILTSIQTERARRLICDVGDLGFRALHARAGLPELYYPAFRGALDVMLELQAAGSEPDKAAFSCLVMDRIGPLYRDVRADDLELLLDRLTRAACATPWAVRAA